MVKIYILRFLLLIRNIPSTVYFIITNWKLRHKRIIICDKGIGDYLITLNNLSDEPNTLIFLSKRIYPITNYIESKFPSVILNLNIEPALLRVLFNNQVNHPHQLLRLSNWLKIEEFNKGLINFKDLYRDIGFKTIIKPKFSSKSKVSCVLLLLNPRSIRSTHNFNPLQYIPDEYQGFQKYSNYDYGDPNIIHLEFEDTLKFISERKCFIIGLRSGLIDLSVFYGNQGIVFYPNITLKNCYELNQLFKIHYFREYVIKSS